MARTRTDVNLTRPVNPCPSLLSYLPPRPTHSEDPFGEQDDLLRLEQDVIVPLAASKKMFVYESKDFWRQIKTAGSAVPASALYLAQFQKTNSKLLTPPGKAGSGGPTILPPVFIDPTAEVDETAKIGPNVSLGGSKGPR